LSDAVAKALMSFCAAMIWAVVTLAPLGIFGASGAAHGSCAITGAANAMSQAPLNKNFRIMCCSLLP
jgi:hypothetical protein